MLPFSPTESKNNSSLRGYCLLDSEDFKVYMNGPIGLLAVLSCGCMNNVNSIDYIIGRVVIKGQY